MSFGFYDKDWVDPDPEREFPGECIECIYFDPCPCGCGYGRCGADSSSDIFDGHEKMDCTEGVYIEVPEPDIDMWRER